MKRNAKAVWSGSLVEGKGSLDVQSGALATQPYSFAGRFVDEEGRSATNPEELIAAAHAGCFAMQLAHFLAENGTPAARLTATATVRLEPDPANGFSILSSALDLVANVPNLESVRFDELANQAKSACPVSRALAAIEITLNARLE